MKIAILSDIHDQVPNLNKALQSASDCDALLCCGDLNSPFVAKALGEKAKGAHVLWTLCLDLTKSWRCWSVN